jgi:hypothetical protein
MQLQLATDHRTPAREHHAAKRIGPTKMNRSISGMAQRAFILKRVRPYG